jgi:hypothetical protein
MSVFPLVYLQSRAHARKNGLVGYGLLEMGRWSERGPESFRGTSGRSRVI